ncbi:MAG: TlpA disulfide reductase family protein [Bacteroidota bacterium]|jgi:peroxiredoxin
MQKFLLLFLLVPVFSFAQNANGFEIKAKINGLKDSTKVSLKSGSEGKILASAISLGGEFVLKGKLENADICILSFSGLTEVSDLFITNELVTIIGDISNVKAFQFAGSETEKDYLEFKNLLDPYKEKLNGLATKINQEKDQNLRSTMMKEFTDLKQQVIDSASAFMYKKPGSSVSPFVLYAISPLMEGGTSQLEPYYTKFSGNALKGPYATALGKAINDAKLGSVGSMAIDFTQKDVTGKPVSLSSFKGKYVLLDFWASWCGPCRQENPNLVRAYNRYKAKNFTVLGISLDQEKSRWLDAIKADGLTWTQLSDLKYWNNAVAQIYKIQSIPANMLIDPTGRIVGKNLRGAELDEMLKSIFK